jgi:Fanconi anemia group M protein
MEEAFPFKLRPYQSAIVDSIKQYGSTLVVLPTGLGKTVIAFSIIHEFLTEERGLILFLAPTKPLVEQHFSSFKRHFPKKSDSAILITGEIKKDKRKHLYASAKLIFATPQTISNDIENKVFNPKDVALVIFDEAHRAIGSYAYVLIAKALPDDCLRIGLTASPGGERKRIKEVMENLGIANVELRTNKSSDVLPYIMPMEIKWVFVELSQVHKTIQKLLMHLSKSLLSDLNNMGVVVTIKSKKRLLESRARLLALPQPYRFKVLLPYFTLVLAQHALELLETEGLYSLKAFLGDVEKKKTRSARVFLKKPEVKKILSLLEKTNISSDDHPKLRRLLSLVESLKNKKIIIFSQYRSQVERITNMLREEGFKAQIFLGKRKGFSQKYIF